MSQLDPSVKLTQRTPIWAEYYILVNGVLRGFVFPNGHVTESVTGYERQTAHEREDATWHRLDAVTIFWINKLARKFTPSNRSPGPWKITNLKT